MPPPTARLDRHALRRSMRLSLLDAAAYALMLGLGEAFFLADAIRLGTGPLEQGLVVSLPLCLGALGPVLALRILARLGRRRPCVVGGALGQALVLASLAVGDAAGVTTPAALVALSCVYQIAGQAAGTAWSSWYGDLVPARIRGRYFSRRTRGAHLATFAGLIASGLILHGFEPAEAAAANASGGRGFAIAYALAALARLVSAALLAASAEGRFSGLPARARVARFLATERGTAAWRQLVLVALLMFAAYLASPYFTPYMLEELGFSYLEYTAATATILAAKVLFLPVWGAMVDRVGARTVCVLAAFLIGGMLLPWMWAKGLAWVLVTQAGSGLSWAGLELANFTLLLDSSWRRARPHVFAALSVLHGSAQLLGSLAGGVLAENLRERRVLFALSMVGRLAAAYALAALLPAPKPVRPGRRREFFLRLVGIRPNAGIAHRPVVGPSAWPSAESRAVRRERRRRQLR